MPTPTYDLISSTTLATSTSSVTFSGFPTDGTYRDLVLVCDATSASGTVLSLRYNSDTGSNYSTVFMFGSSGGTGAGGGTSTSVGILTISTTKNNIITSIMDFSATDKHKTGLSRANRNGDTVSALASTWANTSAITTLQVFGDPNTFDAGSRFDLYGIAS